MTGVWEKKLRLIEKGEYQLEVFKQELFQMVRELTDEVIFNTNAHTFNIQATAATVEPPKEKRERKPKEKIEIDSLDCPKCKSAKIMKGKTAVGCANFKECGFKIPFELLGKKLTEAQLIQLITKGKTGQIKGFVIPGSADPKVGKLVLDGTFNVGLE